VCNYFWIHGHFLFFLGNMLAMPRYFFGVRFFFFTLTCGVTQDNSIIVWLNKKFILRNKFIRHNWVHDACCEIKYLDLYLSLNFSSLVFSYYQLLFYVLFAYIIVWLKKLFKKIKSLNTIRYMTRVARSNILIFIYLLIFSV
jgi:hypothetical protein